MKPRKVSRGGIKIASKFDDLDRAMSRSALRASNGPRSGPQSVSPEWSQSNQDLHFHNLPQWLNPRPIPGMMDVMEDQEWPVRDWDGFGEDSLETSSAHRNLLHQMPPMLNPRPIPGMGMGGQVFSPPQSNSMNSISSSFGSPGMMFSPNHGSPDGSAPSSLSLPVSLSSSGRKEDLDTKPPLLKSSTPSALSTQLPVINGSMTVKQIITKMIDCQVHSILYLEGDVVLGILNISTLLDLVLREATDSKHEY